MDKNLLQYLGMEVWCRVEVGFGLSGLRTHSLFVVFSSIIPSLVVIHVILITDV